MPTSIFAVHKHVGFPLKLMDAKEFDIIVEVRLSHVRRPGSFSDMRIQINCLADVGKMIETFCILGPRLLAMECYTLVIATVVPDLDVGIDISYAWILQTGDVMDSSIMLL